LLRSEKAGVFELCLKQKVKINDKVEEVWRPEKWYSSLYSAIVRFHELAVSEADVESIEDLLHEVRRIQKELTDVYRSAV